MSTQATNTAVIRNFKGNFRAATREILNTAGWTDVVLERSMARLKATARKEVTFHLGQQANVETLPSGLQVADYFAARLRIRIVTSRRQDQSYPGDEAHELHENFVADALDIFAYEKAPYTEALLPYYAVKPLVTLGTNSDLDILHFEDFTDIDFAIEFGIRSTAWPTSYLLPA